MEFIFIDKVQLKRFNRKRLNCGGSAIVYAIVHSCCCLFFSVYWINKVSCWYRFGRADVVVVVVKWRFNNISIAQDLSEFVQIWTNFWERHTRMSFTHFIRNGQVSTNEPEIQTEQRTCNANNNQMSRSNRIISDFLVRFFVCPPINILRLFLLNFFVLLLFSRVCLYLFRFFHFYFGCSLHECSK